MLQVHRSHPSAASLYQQQKGWILHPSAWRGHWLLPAGRSIFPTLAMLSGRCLHWRRWSLGRRTPLRTNQYVACIYEYAHQLMAFVWRRVSRRSLSLFVDISSTGRDVLQYDSFSMLCGGAVSYADHLVEGGFMDKIRLFNSYCAQCIKGSVSTVKYQVITVRCL